MVADAQQRLAALGYEPGPADGLFGPRTRTAILQFQTDEGLRRTGGLSAATLAALTAGP